MSQYWSLQAVGWGLVLIRKWQPPRGLTPMNTPRTTVASVLVPAVSHSCPPTSAGHPPILAGNSGPVFYGATAFIPFILVHMRTCVCPPRVQFLYLPVLWNSCSQTTLAFKAIFSGGYSSHLGSLMWSSELLFLQENFCGIIIFQFLGSPPGVFRILFYCDCASPTILLWLLCL